MTDANLVDKLKLIRHKLKKYMESNDNLKETEIVDCLKILKKKNDPEYSPKANNLISKWKIIITNQAEKEEELKKESSLQIKCEPKEISSSKINLSKSSSDLNKKRSSSDLLNDSSSKKPKISISDYKTKTNIKEESEDYYSLNLNDLSKEKSENDLNNVNINTSKSDSSTKFSIIPPKPTVALKDILPASSITSSSLPNISRNYQSIVSNILSNDDKPINKLADDEALAKIFSSKQSKRILYTGRKHAEGSTFQVPKLFDLATRCLTESIDELHTRISIYNSKNKFPIAFDMIRAVLERANAKQLQNVEYYSPHLLEDTDYLWKRLCEQEFKKIEPPDEDENWRDLYFRKFDEREEKFRRARDLISRKQAEKPKERQTQFATVKFVGSTSKSSSMPLSSSSAASKIKTLSSSSGPVRQIVHDSVTKKGSSNFPLGGGKKPIPSAPAMSQGMKATMKLLKKTTRR